MVVGGDDEKSKRDKIWEEKRKQRMGGAGPPSGANQFMYDSKQNEFHSS